VEILKKRFKIYLEVTEFNNHTKFSICGHARGLHAVPRIRSARLSHRIARNAINGARLRVRYDSYVLIAAYIYAMAAVWALL
jgi:hypothetical protein